MMRSLMPLNAADMFRIRLRELYVRHHVFVRDVCLRYVQNSDDADDLAHDVLVNAARGWSAFKGECAFTTWLYQVAVNRCRDHLRNRRRAVHGLRRFARESLAGDSWRVGYFGAAHVVDPLSDHLVAKRVLEALLDHYEGALRHMVVLWFDHGLPHTHISRITGVPRAAVRRRLTHVIERAGSLYMEFENQRLQTARAP
jgi:RNA polymerase sigma factor (sigma-70 family)